MLSWIKKKRGSSQNEQSRPFEIKLFEHPYNRKIIGKPVLDKGSRLIGAVESLIIKPDGLFIRVKGINHHHFLLPWSKIADFYSVIELNTHEPDIPCDRNPDAMAQLEKKVVEEHELLWMGFLYRVPSKSRSS